MITCRSVFSVWPKTLPVWPRDAKSLDTPAGAWSFHFRQARAEDGCQALATRAPSDLGVLNSGERIDHAVGLVFAAQVLVQWAWGSHTQTLRVSLAASDGGFS